MYFSLNWTRGKIVSGDLARQNELGKPAGGRGDGSLAIGTAGVPRREGQRGEDSRETRRCRSRGGGRRGREDRKSFLSSAQGWRPPDSFPEALPRPRGLRRTCPEVPPPGAPPPRPKFSCHLCLPPSPFPVLSLYPRAAH